MTTHAGKYDLSGIRDTILKLHIQGRSRSRVAAELGISINTVNRIINEEVRERWQNREELKNRVAAQIEMVKQTYIEDHIRLKEAKLPPHRQSDELLLKLLAEESRLFGLHEAATIRVEVEQMSDEQLQTELARLGVAVNTNLKQLPAPEPDIEDAEILTPEPATEV